MRFLFALVFFVYRVPAFFGGSREFLVVVFFCRLLGSIAVSIVARGDSFKYF